MKKKVFGLCLVCLIGAFLYFLLRPVPPGPEQDYYADFLPEDTVALIGLYDMEGLSEKFPGTPLGHFLSKPVMHEMMGEFGALEQDLEKYDALYDAVADTLTNQLFRRFFGDDAIIAFYPPDPERLQENPEQELKRALMVFGSSSSAGLISRLACLFMGKEVSSSSISGLNMVQIRLEDDEMLYGYDDQGIIMLAYDPKRIVIAVEQQKSGKVLRHSPLFSATETFWKGQEQKAGKGQMKGQVKGQMTGQVYARSYLNGLVLQELLSSFAQENVQNIMDDLAGIESVGALLVDEGGELRLRIRGERDPELVSEDDLPEENTWNNEALVSALVQEQTVLHYRTASFDKAFFRRLLFAEASDQQFAALEKTIQEEVGFSLDKFLEAVGPQAGISIHKVVNAGVFPLPQTILAFRVQNKKGAGWALRKLRDTLKKQGFANEHNEKAGGSRLYYWTVMPMEATHLAIVLTDTMLYIANGESQLRTLLEEQPDFEALTGNMVKELGETAGSCVPTANSSAFLLRPQRLAEQFAPVADWLIDITEANGSGPGKKVQKELLTLMRSFDSISACSDRAETYVNGELIFKPLPGEKRK
ncbi:MAG: hypothetical protein Q3M24_00025 [Candidatus Electrothrix aestuarii]|uniref:DUF3352 domain-containing protein n=1 Tax=Candidatus Electrothrix aestuarii TaxID=3062594 RepID=A0AAU8LWE8_9BACT|nr:hypothetical protein [Candidatus Electrothrix aestuarii]